jgi:hypothetical protein
MSDESTGPRGTTSLEIVLEEARAERAAQLQHFDALDAKAGVLLGFSAALVALRRRYLGANSRFTKLALLDPRLEMLEEAADLLRRKARRLQLAITSLAAAMLLVAVGIPLH